MTDPVLRIGRGVPGRRKTLFGIKAEWVIAASVLIAVSLMIAAVYLFDRPDDGTDPVALIPTSAVANQVECVGIQRAYGVWQMDRMDLAFALTSTGLAAEIEMDDLLEDADALDKAVTGYDDLPSKELAVAVIEYKVVLNLANLEVIGGGEVPPGRQSEVIGVREEIEERYKFFAETTCG